MSLGQENPIYPWMKVVTDIFHFKSDSYLLIVDYTSRFPVVWKLTSTTMQQVASQMKVIFSGYGWPETTVSGNRPCYSAETFTKLMTDYSMNHITSSPLYPQLKGLAEKYVQIVKNLFYTAQEEGTHFYKILMIYRNTLLSNTLQSPMQILQSWTARTQLSILTLVGILWNRTSGWSFRQAFIYCCRLYQVWRGTGIHVLIWSLQCLLSMLRCMLGSVKGEKSENPKGKGKWGNGIRGELKNKLIKLINQIKIN